MAEISFEHATADDKEAALGREFREIHVESANFDGAGVVVAILEGRRVALIGNPQQALTTYLGGVMQRIETQGEH
jgi:hypothetical protein